MVSDIESLENKVINVSDGLYAVSLFNDQGSE